MRCRPGRERRRIQIAGADSGAAGTGREQEHGVVRRSVAVYGDAVEADFDGFAQICVQCRGLDGGVGEDVYQHGGVRHELRMNHAGTLADSGDADFLANFSGAVDLGSQNFNARKGGLLYGVGGDDGFCNLLEVVGLRADGFGKVRQCGDEFFRRQRNADDAGGGWEDFFWLAAECFGCGFAGGAGCIDTGLTHGAVGVAGIDGDDADLAGGGAEVFRVNEKWRGFDAVAGERGRSRCRGVGND